jgi:hypothetical protein
MVLPSFPERTGLLKLKTNKFKILHAGEGPCLTKCVAANGSMICWADGRELKVATVHEFEPRGKVLKRESDNRSFTLPRPIKAITLARGGRLLVGTDNTFGVVDLVRADRNIAVSPPVTLPFEPKVLFQGASGRPWCANLQAKKALFLDDGNRGQEFSLAVDSLGDLAEGPGGALWATDPMAGALHRLDPTTLEWRTFTMPIKGSRPFKIVDGMDGNMYFTLMGSTRIGAIAAEAPAPAAPDAAASWETAAKPKPGPPPRKKSPPQSGPEREERPGPAGTSAAATTAVTVPAAPTTAAATTTGVSARVPAGSAWHNPAIRRINWQHIQEEHANWAPNGKGQFLEGDTRPWLEGKLRAAAQAATYWVLQHNGRRLLYEEFPETIGFTWSQASQRYEPTRKMVIVLSEGLDEVITAYPVKDFP